MGGSAFAGDFRRERRNDKKGLKILILGGTGFLGPACTEAAIAAGHTVTHFNRGRTEARRKERGRPSAVPDGVEILYGNRDPEKTADDGKPDADAKSPKGLESLKGRTWDAVIDTSGYWPRHVKASAELLAPSVKQYVFISSVSVYAKNDKPGADETAPLSTLADPKIEDFGAQFENYGGGKAMAEAAAEAAMPGRVTNIRPGFIVGPRDTSGRYIYWPLRCRRGGEVLVPGSESDPIQMIDVRDLADFTIKAIEDGTTGVFNATGPEQPLTMRAFLEAVTKAAKSENPPTFTWVPMEFLAQSGIPVALPLYVPPSGETAGFHRVSIARALAKGLKFRSPEDTARTMLAWVDTLPPDLQKGIAGNNLSPEDEAKLLEAWKASKK
jgi:2'-hydroxyisoflavone reductase